MGATTILLVDDDEAFRSRVREALGGVYRLTEVADPEGVRRLFRPNLFDLVILDLKLREGREGLDLLREIRLQDELQPVIMVSAYGDTETTLEAVASGALMFLHKREFSPELLARMVEAVLRQGRLERRAAILEERLRQNEPAEFVGASPVAREARRFARQAADSPDALVVVAGETGSGRELMARLIHDQSRQRRQQPFVSLGARSLAPGQLMEALFGMPGNHLPRHRGALERAQGGVLFLEDGLPLPEQVENELWVTTQEDDSPTDGDGCASRDVQLILGPRSTDATGWPTRATARAFLELHLSPLRERREDISLLSAYFLQRLRTGGKTSAQTVSPQALRSLERHDWPGNVQELRIAVEFGALQALLTGADELGLSHLPPTIPAAASIREVWNFRLHLARAEVWLTSRAIEEKGLEQRSALAEALGYNDRIIFTRRLKKRLEEFPGLRSEFPKVSHLLGS